MKYFSERFPKHRFIIVNGAEVPCDADVVLWKDSKLETVVGDGARRRHPKTEIDIMGWHWTGAENDIDILFGTLDTRELGVEFAIDAIGVVFQFCDPAKVDTFDIGFINPRSAGCEIVNHGFKRGEIGKRWQEQAALRDGYRATINGMTKEYKRYFASQLNSIVALGNAVSASMPIPKNIPALSDGSLPMSVLSKRQIANYSGHLGHFHVNDEKFDPGVDLFTALRANGWVPTRV